MRGNAYNPSEIMEIPEHMHTLAIAYFAATRTRSGKQAFYVAESSVAVLAHGSNDKRIMMLNKPLVVSVELFNLLGDEFMTPEVDIGMQYGGELEAGTMIYSGVNTPMRAIPPLADDTVTISNSYYQARRGHRDRLESDSSGVDLSGDLSEWIVNDGSSEDSMDAPLTERVTCSMFPADKKKVTLNPSSDGGFERVVAESHMLRTNGRLIPREWEGLRQLLSNY